MTNFLTSLHECYNYINSVALAVPMPLRVLILFVTVIGFYRSYFFRT